MGVAGVPGVEGVPYIDGCGRYPEKSMKAQDLGDMTGISYCYIN